MMELKKILNEGTAKTPLVDFNNLTGDLILSGRSIPENAALVYEPILKWVNNYIKNPRQTTNLRLNIEYFNTASSIWIAKIVKALSRMENTENVLIIHLYFELEEFDNMGSEDIKDALSPVLDIITTSTISIGIKIYGTDENGKIIKESMILL
jgi:SiaC family regulatory phosphoprotein